MSATLKSVMPPLPETRRGYGIQVHATAKNDQFAYCNGKHVIIRSIDDPDQCTIFAEHKCAVSVAKFSPNGEWVASGDGRGRVLVWSVKTQIIKSEVNVCRNVLDIAWSPDGKRIIAVGDGNDSFARAFMWDSGNTVGDITNHSKQILSCDHKPTRPFRVVTCAEDKHVNFYQGPPFRFEKLFDGHTRYPNQVRFAPDGSVFVSVGSDKKINVFDGKTGEFMREIASDDGHTGSIWSCSWSPDSKQLLTVSGDSTAKIWNIEDSTVATTFTFPSDGTNSHQQVGCIWHKEHLITVSLSGAINFLDRANPSTPLRTLAGHTTTLSALAVDSSRHHVYTSSANGAVYRWNPDTNELMSLARVGDGAANVSGLGFLTSSNSVVTTSFDDVVRVCSSEAEGMASCPSEKTDGQPVAVATSSDDMFAVVTRKKVVAIYQKGNKVADASLSFVPTGVAFAADGSELAVSGDKNIHVFAVNGNQLSEKPALERHTDTTYCIAYSPDGRFIATADGQRYIYVWDRSSGKVMNPTGWRFHSARVTGLAFSPDSSKLASCGVDQNVLVWKDLAQFNSERYRIEPAHIGGAQRVEFLDDNHVVSIGDDRTIKLWELGH